MIELPLQKFYSECKKKRKTFLILCIISFSLLVAAIVILSVFINYLNQIVMLYAGGAGLVVLTLVSMFLLICFLIPYSKRCKHLYKIFYANRNLISGTIYAIGEKIKVNKEAYGLEIIINDKNEKYIVYWDYELIDCPLKVGDNIKLIEGASFITSYEVNNNE